jgi:glucose-6-phosphate isomerase
MRVLTHNTTGTTDGLIAAHASTLTRYRAILRSASEDRTYATPESALGAVRDEESIRLAHSIRSEFGGDQLKTLFLVGIGGSDLGTRAVYEATHGVRAGRSGDASVTLVPFDTIEPSILSRVPDMLKKHERPEEVLLVVVSKSGSTTETIMNANVLFDYMVQHFGKEAAASRTLFIGDQDIAIGEGLRTKGIRHIAMPKRVGGRYSVFTPVGLVPLALLGVDVDAFCEGAGQAITASIPEEGHGPASTMASLMFEAYLNGLTMHELFIFHPELETLGKWYRQLLAESIGKQRQDSTRVGIMPTVAIGSTDLHSLGQLVFGGPRNRFTTFVAAPSLFEGGEPYRAESPFTLGMLEGRTAGDAMRAIYKGVRAAYKSHNMPFIRIELDEINAREMGAFMGLHMASVMYLAELFNVNAFDQPAVESYKRETRRILSNDA